MPIYRLGHVEIRVPDLELCAAYYTEVLGLREVERDAGHVYLKGWDEWDHHSVILTEASRYGIEHLAFKTESLDDLENYETVLERYGCTVERVEADEERALGEAIRFDTPSGHVMEIYESMERVGNGLSMYNPPPMPMDLVGIAPPRLDHCLLTAENVPDIARFMSEALQFRLTEQMVSSEGHQLIVFFERSHQPHDVAFTRGANGGLHHFAFWLDSWSDVGRAADILRMNGIDIDVGPTRHGITRGHTVYFFDPVGNRNEVFSGGYRTDHDWQTITWTEDQFGKALFYYENRVVDSFVSVYSWMRRVTRDDAPAYLARYEARRADSAVEGRHGEPHFVTRARERATRRALAELDQPTGPPGRTEAFARETVAPRELQWPASMRPRVISSTDVRLIRHGQTQGYITDSALTPLGRWQAHRKGQDLAKGLQEGSVARIVHAPTARAAETADALTEGILQAVARYGIGGVTIEGPEPVDAFRNFQCWFDGRELDVTAAFQEFATLLEGYERHGGGDRPGWMVELDRFWRIQFAGGDPITSWLTQPTHFVEPPAYVVRRYWEGIVDEVEPGPEGMRLYVCAHSGPLRAVAAAAVGHDPGEPHNVEDVRIRLDGDLAHATLTYRGRAVTFDVPTAVTPSWFM